MNKQRKNEKGFTMIELIIVVAIMGILAAILVPSFASMSRRTRVSSDIRAIQIIQKQIDLYYADRGQYPASGGTISDGAEIGATCGSYLAAEGLVELKYFVGRTATNAIALQTSGAKAVWDSSKAHAVLDTTVCDGKVKEIITNIKNTGALDADWVK